MDELRGTGYFRELADGDPSGPSLRDSCSATAQPDEDRIVAYLEESPTMLWSPTLVYDVLRPEVDIGTETIKTDGVWEWPADLAYYVRRYHVAMEPEFVAHMRARGWSPPLPQQVDLDVAAMLGIAVDEDGPVEG